ncbi:MULTISPECIES: alpha/beta hydrolase [unclassified Acinetobacter]|uniref:alpha/beta hydrolase n=1 Tax=unclassified Acinetobacter TaxID=196816 RepID=UPI00244D1719|nr:MULTISPECIES: alpha/beta hydrolase [unclassified Acinetobacter]MDH0030460.1 alpha/beta hydrolase [Acinetobacter sp. GD04021]MDH0885651.1 alpha/beta hydrolase [Acinetobacter sp. GD03873]MDH1082033.1 alpha/beta hydrolase [Acinetobacter sp. GD03983]MDH2188937.1 alpha/beta hydrolase [Acinetobacter sp. GD03645]MDH2202502.1 alpha/beta hydrolase [Acinetobacter sp. GD03647]
MKQLIQQVQENVIRAKNLYQEFRLYDFASYSINYLTPKDTFEKEEHLAYGLKARQRLDLYRSKNAKKQRPLIVFVHGGSWQHGNKRDYLFIGETFAREGYDVAVINYHLAPEHIFPAFIDDLAQAIHYLTQNQNKLNISTDNMILMGHSAGAFNVMSVVYSAQSQNFKYKDQIKAIVGLAGPYHFDYVGDPLSEHAFDQKISYQQVMPYYFIEPNQIKHYLLVAEQDQLVERKNTLDLDIALRQKGNHSHIAVIPKTGHITIVATLASLMSHYFKTKRTILHFLEEALES